MNVDKILHKLNIRRSDYKDLHILRYYASFVAVSKGKIIKMTDPYLAYCPLACTLYRAVKKLNGYDVNSIKESIKMAVMKKIVQFGFFTKKREIFRKDIAIPYGASEMLMCAMKKNIIDAVVLVCDGAGTVIVDTPEIAQGIGARMNGLFLTSPLYEVMEKLEKAGCHVVFRDALIGQIKGIKEAAKLGYKKMAVTINGSMQEKLKEIKLIEKKYRISVTTLIVCTTGVTKERAEEIRKYADVVWSCASEEIRTIVGKKAILQISGAIPVFVLTKEGLNLVAGYSSNEHLIRALDLKKQFFISGKNNRSKNRKFKMGNCEVYLSKSTLPVRTDKEPKLLKGRGDVTYGKFN